MQGAIFNIQKFSLHDGAGIRTNVFFKGCALRCRWCSNPESQGASRELMLRMGKCLRCGACIGACPRGAISRDPEGAVVTRRDACDGCGACADACLPGARELQGRTATVGEIMEEIRRDAVFYRQSGGGVTLTGGEPMLQAPFATALARRIVREGLTVAVETCGHADTEGYRAISPYVSCFLFDVKHTDTERHRQGTGKDNALILGNLRALRGMGANVVVRTPVIPGWNDGPGTISAICALCRELGISRIHFLPYHDFARPKYEGLGRAYPMGDAPRLALEDLEPMRQIAARYGLSPCLGG